MNFQEIKELIEQLKEKEIETDYDDTFMEKLMYNDAPSDFPPYTIVYIKGGGEGEGESVVRVLKFENDIYIKFTGYYYSYDGTTWDDEITQVYPAQETITVYVEKMN